MKNQAHKNRIAKRHRRQKMTAARNKMRAAGFNFAGQARNKAERLAWEFRLTPAEKDRRELLQSMSGWQRMQMMRECKGDIRRMPTARLHFWARTPYGVRG